MLEDLLDRGEPRNITVLYGNRHASEIAYRNVLDEARLRLGVMSYYAVQDPDGSSPAMHIGFVDEEMIRATVTDFAERTFYVSGPQSMVDGERRLLRRLGVPFWRIKTDFFPGLA